MQDQSVNESAGSESEENIDACGSDPQPQDVKRDEGDNSTNTDGEDAENEDDELDDEQNPPELSARQERALAAMLACPSTPEAARKSGIGLRTIQRWLSQDKNFEARYRGARREIFARTVQELQDNTPAVTRELMKVVIAEKTPATARVMAARALLEFGFRGAEFIHVTEQLEVTQEALADAERRKPGGR